MKSGPPNAIRETPTQTIRACGFDVLIDAADLPLLRGRYVSVVKTGRTRYARIMLAGKKVKVHRVILGVTDPETQVDHINGNGLDNRRCNLRLCIGGRNCWNARKFERVCSSRFKGVYRVKGRRNSFSASIGVNSKRIKLGRFFDEIAAALAYDIAAVNLFGAFARPNFTISEAALVHPESFRSAIERCKRKGIVAA